MSNPYESLSSEEQNAHLNNTLAGYPSIYPSGEAHFFDFSQNNIVSSSTNNVTGIFDRNGLISPFSNGPQSRNYAITDFKTFNPYRHYINTSESNEAGFDTAYKINISELLTKSTYEFNIYSTSFRTSVSQSLNNT